MLYLIKLISHAHRGVQKHPRRRKMRHRNPPLNLWSHYTNRVKFALNIHGIPGFRNVNADITGLSFRSPNVRDCCWWMSFMQWKTEPAGLFITRDRLAANAAFSPRTHSGNTERAYFSVLQIQPPPFRVVVHWRRSRNFHPKYFIQKGRPKFE